MTIRVLAAGRLRADLPEEMVIEIRRRISDGFYERPTTVEEVSRRILESGDLDCRHPLRTAPSRGGPNIQRWHEDSKEEGE